MLLLSVISLYTVRVVLSILGVRDYGIYNVVGGIAASFSVLSSTMASATQRFFAFEIGRKDETRLRLTFSMSIIIYIALSVLILIFAETVGRWFLNAKLNIPGDRVTVANVVYQFTVLSFIFTILRVPFNAIIIAREYMRFYAYLSILEALFKLIIVYLLAIFLFDKLILYSILIFGVTVLITTIYFVFCSWRFPETRFSFIWSSEVFRTIGSYSGWSVFGTLTTVSFEQGLNFLLNIFFGPIVNASRAIAYQINGTLSSFALNFYSAVHPQIVKSYAESNNYRVIELVFNSTRYCFYLFLIISLPLLWETEFFLRLWLKDVPLFSASFVRLILIFSFLNFIQAPITAAVQATGDIRRYEIVIGSIMLMCLPLSYLLIVLGCAPISSFYAMIVVSVIALFFRLIILKNKIDFSYRLYIRSVLSRIILVAVVSCIIPFLLIHVFFKSNPHFGIMSLICVLSAMGAVWILGLNKVEKVFCISFFERRLALLK